jgi:8-oxo-dGTP pyrophosphatase MutT (NUDIX family)
MGEAKRRKAILGDRYGRAAEPVLPAKARAVIAYIERDGLLLSVSRRDTGEHAVPGGKVEPGETLLAALMREVREETNLEISDAVEVYRGPHTSGREVVAFRCTAHGEPAALEEGTRVEWVRPERIAEGFGAAYHRIALVAAGYLPKKVEPMGAEPASDASVPPRPTDELNKNIVAAGRAVSGRNRRNVLSLFAGLSVLAGTLDLGPAPLLANSRRGR